MLCKDGESKNASGKPKFCLSAKCHIAAIQRCIQIVSLNPITCAEALTFTTQISVNFVIKPARQIHFSYVVIVTSPDVRV